MKKIFTLLVVCGFAFNAFAQFDYITTTGVDANYDPTLPEGTTVMSNPADETMSAPQTLPFTFDYWGNSFTSYQASDNGYIVLGNSAGASVSANEDLSLGTAPRNALFSFWEAFELGTGAGTPDAIRSSTSGSSPNRIHTIQWVSITPSASVGSAGTYCYLAIRIYECGNFELISNWTNGGGYSGSIGCTGPTATDFAQIGSGMEEFPVVGNFTPALNKVFRFAPGATYPANDAMANNLTFPTINEVGNHSISGVLANNGSAVISSVEMSYSINGGSAVTEMMSATIASGGSYNYTFSTPYVSSAAGAFNVEVWASQVNGATDDFSCNDKGTGSFEVYTATTDRVPLHESFTSSTCGPCVAGNSNVKAVMAATSEEEVIVKYQMSWPGDGDPYYTDEGGVRRNFYAINSVPWMMIDGGWDGNSQSYNSTVYQNYKSNGALVEVSGEYSIDADNQTLGIDLTVNAISDISGDFALYVAILERTTYDNVGSNGETEFDYVMKKMVPGSSGYDLGSSLTANTPVDYSTSYTFSGSKTLPPNANSPVNHSTEHSVEEFNDIIVAVWVQDNTSKFVHQSNFAVLVESANGVDGTVDPNDPTGPPLSVKAEIGNNGYSLYPNPASDIVNIAVEGSNGVVTVFDAIGNLVYSESMNSNQTQINTSEFVKGLYLIQIENNGSVISEKLTIK